MERIKRTIGKGNPLIAVPNEVATDPITWSATLPKDMVMVRRDDLRLALVWSSTADNHMNKSPWYNRLKAALDQGQKIPEATEEG